MVEVNPSDHNCNDRSQDQRQIEKPALNTPEGHQVRNATGDQVEAIKAANPNAHDGSATPKDKIKAWQEQNQALIEEQSKSLELFEDDKLIAARVMEVAKSAVIAKENIEQQSKTVEELTKLAKVNSVYEPILGLRQHAESLPPGQEKDKFVQLAKDQVAETKRQFREPENQSEDQEACGSHTVPPQKLMTTGQDNYSSNYLLAYDNQHSGIVTDATEEQAVENSEQDKKQANNSDYQNEKQKDLLKGYAQSPEQPANEWLVVKQLPPQYLREVAKAFDMGSQVGQESIKETSDEILRRTGQGYIDTAVNTVKFPLDVLTVGGKAVWTLLEYDRDLIINHERARENADKAGEHLGKALIVGIKLSDAITAYGGELSQSGDYGRPLRTIARSLNASYEKLSPADQMALTSEVCAGFGMAAGTTELNKLRKSGTFVAFLNEAADAIPRNPEAERRAIETTKKLIQALGVTPNGRLALASDNRIIETALEKRRFRSPDTGMEHTPGEAAKLAGVDIKLKPLDKMKALLAKGYELIEPKVYHIEGLEKPLSETGLARRLGITKEQLRAATPEKLHDHGITAIEPVKGGLPRNYKYAGKTYAFSEEHPEQYKKLCQEFPKFAEKFKEGVRYTKEGYPEFSSFRQGKDYKFEHLFTGHTADFKEADEFIWPHLKTATARRKERERLGLTWHHCEDGHTLQLVPSDLHSKVPHTGGIAIVKALRGK